MVVWLRRILFAAAAVPACSTDGGSDGRCRAGDVRSCEAETGCSGEQRCLPSGTEWSACECGDGGGGGEAGAETVCEVATLPSRPSVTAAGGNRTFVAAARDLFFGSETHVVGFDLDGAGAGCTPPSSDHVRPVGWCAADNQLGQLLTAASVTSDVINEPVEAGAFSLLVGVRDYTGTEDDDEVIVDLLIGAPFGALQPGQKPAFDGEDDWAVSSFSLTGDEEAPGEPRYSSTSAYVTRGKLGARFEETVLRLPFSLSGHAAQLIDLRLENISLTCDVERLASTWQLHDCILGGVVDAKELFSQLSRWKDSLDPEQGPVCQGQVSYPIIKPFLCKFVGAGSAGTCDAFSVGLRFDTAPALATNAYTEEPFQSKCATGTDPGEDSCE